MKKQLEVWAIQDKRTGAFRPSVRGRYVWHNKQGANQALYYRIRRRYDGALDCEVVQIAKVGGDDE